MTTSGSAQIVAIQKGMQDATTDCIKILSPQGQLLAMNRAGCQALSVDEHSDFGMPWLPLLPPEVHQQGAAALARAAAGKNARFPGQSISPEGTFYWDNLLTPILDADGHVSSIVCVSRDITTQTRLERDLEEALSRERLLSQEMQHRIKNLFSIVHGLVSLSEREAAHHKTPHSALDILRQKVNALARASDAVFAAPALDHFPENGIDLASLVQSVLAPYGEQCRIKGATTRINRNHMTTLALLLHELATNALKYGALSRDQGCVHVRWTLLEDRLELHWSEQDGPQISAPPDTEGFGSSMVERIVRSVGGHLHKIWHADGLALTLDLPHVHAPMG